jgi:hypothetical protein
MKYLLFYMLWSSLLKILIAKPEYENRIYVVSTGNYNYEIVFEIN